MKDSKIKCTTIDEYHSLFHADVQRILIQLRHTIKQAAPNTTETISYGMPSFKQNKMLVYYAVYKKHIGFYPTPNPIQKFKKELAKYKTSKGAIQFPIDKPLPFSLITMIVKFRAKEDLEIVKPKSNKNINTKTQNIGNEILAYNRKQITGDKDICDALLNEICRGLPKADSKIWHGHPVWFLDGNPIAGYSKEKRGIRLMFWSGASFDEEGLEVRGGKFKDASIFYISLDEIKTKDLKHWLKKSKDIQWDYKNIVKRKGVLERLK